MRMTVIDVSEADFEREVIERSRALPVVVDFWAEWCGPCRQLGPLLEQAAAEREGKVVLAKLDTDANPNLAQVFQIRGIPAVKAFSDGRVADEFVGAQGHEAVERFFDALLPSEVDLLVASGKEDDLRRALELQPSSPDAALGLARMLIARGEADEALEVLAPVSGSFQADGLAARLRLEKDDQLSDAFAALDRGELEHALEQLLAALPSTDRRREDIRRVIVGELDALGPEHPLARDTRSRLASALY
jgi:putative thioredoxin